MGCFRSAEACDLLHNKFVVVLGDSIQRSVYKDLVKLLQSDTFVSEAKLRRKGEVTFANDTLVEGGALDGLHNGTTYREVRQYRSGHHLVRFYFLTRVYSKYLESILSDFQSGPQPDVLMANSCVWDLTRYEDKEEAYKTNLDNLFQRLKEVLSPKCLIIWNMTMPIGYRDNEIPLHTTHNLRPDIVEGNFFSSRLADFHKLDVLDMHYHFRCNLRLRCHDAVHWNPVAHRKYTQILLNHIAQAWGVKKPEGPTVNVVPPQPVALRKDPKVHHTVQERAHCSQGAVYIPGYTSFDGSGIRAMSGAPCSEDYIDERLFSSNADSPFVTDSPLLANDITHGYFTRSPGPAITNHALVGRNFLLPYIPPPIKFTSIPHHSPYSQEAWDTKITSRRALLRPREGWTHPYHRPPMYQPGMY